MRRRAGATVMVPEVPVMEAVTVSVAVIVWLPAVLRVAAEDMHAVVTRVKV